MKYIGDISREDAQVLATFAAHSFSILEFGAGGSTQVIAQSKHAHAELLCIETDPSWIERTKKNCARLGIPTVGCDFCAYQDWERAAGKRQFDFIFVDGVSEKRLSFARSSWPLLAIGGWIAFHDTRREKEFGDMLALAREHFLEVDRIECSIRASNISAIRKKISEPYVNWNEAEGRTPWMAGYEPPPEQFENFL